MLILTIFFILFSAFIFTLFSLIKVYINDSKISKKYEPSSMYRHQEVQEEISDIPNTAIALRFDKLYNQYSKIYSHLDDFEPKTRVYAKAIYNRLLPSLSKELSYLVEPSDYILNEVTQIFLAFDDIIDSIPNDYNDPLFPEKIRELNGAIKNNLKYLSKLDS